MHPSKKCERSVSFLPENSKGGRKSVRFRGREGMKLPRSTLAKSHPTGVGSDALNKTEDRVRGTDLGEGVENDSESRVDGSDNKRGVAKSEVDTILDEDLNMDAIGDVIGWSGELESGPVCVGGSNEMEKDSEMRKVLYRDWTQNVEFRSSMSGEGGFRLQDSVIHGALSYERIENREKLREEEEAKRRKEKEQEEIRLEEEIRSKPIQVVHLYDKSGREIFEERKIARMKAQEFLKNHFWGSRLERMRNDQFLDQKVIGPAAHFQMPNAREKSLKRKRRGPLATTKAA